MRVFFVPSVLDVSLPRSVYVGTSADVGHKYCCALFFPHCSYGAGLFFYSDTEGAALLFPSSPVSLTREKIAVHCTHCNEKTQKQMLSPEAHEQRYLEPGYIFLRALSVSFLR